jgi:hypothetical protein
MHAFKVRFRLDNGWTRRQMRHVARGRVTLLTFVAAAAMVAGQTEAATFRVDDTRLTVPSILTDERFSIAKSGPGPMGRQSEVRRRSHVFSHVTTAFRWTKKGFA